MASQRDFDVVGLGEALIEFNQTDPAAPVYRQGIGGDTSNAIIAAARAGARTAYLSRYGGLDEFGELLLNLWRAEGVDVSGVLRDDGANNGLYFVQHTPSGHQFSYVRSHSAAARMRPADLGHGIVERSRYLHVSGISLAISTTACDTVFAAMTRARAAGTQVCLDANLRLRLWPVSRARAILREAIAQCDLFLPGVDDMRSLTGLDDPQAILDWVRALNPDAIVVLKAGSKGVIVDDKVSRTHVPPCRVQAVDATGAGDCFAGNLLARLCAGEDWLSACRYANAAAALSTTGYGAVAPLPRPDAVRALLRGV
ncbi:sugar kinase [Bordetella sp. 15P40C-2]|uniref:sugar kinase n=1 Tax=Bordetella sp. 15P40C-2 TaxID=2572246 RepID=UPI00132B3A93|nr:sugar kinase [Bordetella sp. 15P40C-2]MVW70092.1 sugar kinase [Bordetella sp. 15P40C-2]